MRRFRTRDPVPWVIGLFAINFLLQRISIPGLSIPVIVPLSLLWVGLVLYQRVGALNARRLILWMAAAGISAGVVIVQVILVQGPFVSVNSWALWMAVWLPLIVHFRDRRRRTYLRAVRGIGNVGIGIAIMSLSFTVLQYLGLPYRDWLGQFVPSNLLVQGYVVSYPITYGSEIYKSNAWIGLEPSFVSFMLGVCVVAAIVARMHWATVTLLLAAMLSTTAGSGLAIVLTFIAITILTGQAVTLRRYAMPAVVVGVVIGTTLLGQSILSRVTEAGQSRSSTSLRMIEPYEYLWPHWVADPMGVVFGHGPGSSAWIVTNSGVEGLLVPSVAKVLFDYGVIGGVILVALMVAAFVRSPDPRFAFAMAFSMFTVQAASPGLVLCAFCVASFWAPTALQARRTTSAMPRRPLRRLGDESRRMPGSSSAPIEVSEAHHPATVRVAAALAAKPLAQPN